MKDVYKVSYKEKKSTKDLYKGASIPVKRVDPLFRKIEELLHKVINSSDEIKKVEVLNQVEPEKVLFPEIQKVEVTNHKKTEFPDIQKVEVSNLKDIIISKLQLDEIVKKIQELKPERIEFPKIQKVEITNHENVQFPKVQKVEVSNFPKIEKAQSIPTGEGNKVGSADPEKYVVVRLTDGKKFYKALDEMWVSRGGGNSSSNILYGITISGQTKIVSTGTAVQLPNNVLKNGVIITAKSTNAASITIGNNSSLTNTTDGTGNGAILEAGSSTSFAITNTSIVWVNGTSGDIVSYSGS